MANPLLDNYVKGGGHAAFTPTAGGLAPKGVNPALAAYSSQNAQQIAQQSSQGASQARMQKYQDVFKQADPNTRNYLAKQLYDRANKGDQKAAEQFNAIKDIVSAKYDAPKVAGTFGDKGVGGALSKLSSGATTGAGFVKQQAEDLIGQVVGNVSGGTVQGADRPGATNPHSQSANLPNKAIPKANNKDLAINALQARLLVGFPGEGKIVEAIGSKLPGLGIDAATGEATKLSGKLVKSATETGLNLGSSSGLGQLTSDNTKGKNPLQIAGNVAKSTGTGFLQGAALGIGGTALAHGAGDIARLARPIDDATKLNFARTLASVGEHDAAQAVAKAKTAKEVNNILEATKSNVKLTDAYKQAYTPSQLATPDEKRAFDYISNNTPKAMTDYNKLTMKEFGVKQPNIVSGDVGKYVIDGAPGNKSAAYHEPGSALAKVKYQQLLDNPKTKDAPVMIMAGGTGAGKTSSLKGLGLNLDHYAAIVDTNSNKLDSAVSKIEQARATGRPVDVHFVYRDPVDAFANGVIPRAAKEGRIVTKDTHVDTHLGAMDVVKKLQEKYKNDPEVGIHVVDNSLGHGKQAYSTLDLLQQKSYNRDNLHKELTKVLDEHKQTGQLTAEDHAAFLGQSSSEHVTGDQNVSTDGRQLTQETPRQVTEPKGTQLNMTVAPGVAEFAQQDVIPKAQGALAGVKNVIADAKSIIDPANVDKNSRAAADSVTNYLNTSKNEAILNAKRGESAAKYFGKQSDAANIANISHYEKTGVFKDAPKGMTPEEYTTMYKARDAQAKANRREVFSSKAAEIENYVRRAGMFEFKNPTEENKAVQTLLSTKSSLKPYDASNKARIDDATLQERVDAMKAAGVKFKLTTTNPETLGQLSLNASIQAKGFKDLGENLKTQGLIKFSNGAAPEGMVKLNDRAFQVFFPGEAGMVKAGEYYASPSVAKILDNTVSSGLDKYSLFRGLRNVKNNENLIQLGVSAFHAGTTTINATWSGLNMAVRDVLSGHPVQAGKELLSAPFQVIKSSYLGSKAFKGLTENSPEFAKSLKDVINPSGFRLKQEERYKTTVSENFVKAIHNGNPIGAVARAIPALIEQSTKPIMEHLVPNVKLGMMLQKTAQIQRLNPNATDKELQGLFIKASDEMDNTYGQMVYDKAFWNKTTKDLLQISQRSVGWNYGTVRQLGGGITDIAKTVKGEKVGYGGGISNHISDKTISALTLPILVGTYGAIYQYLSTGKPPSSITDYFYPKNGLNDANGNPQRVSLPSYMKDVVAYGHDPIGTVKNKLSGPLNIIGNIASNQNYYKDMIRNPDDPVSKQLSQVGKYLITAQTPFSIQGQTRVANAGGGNIQRAESFLGVAPGPSWTTKSGFEQSVLDKFGKQLNQGPLTPEQQDLNQQKSAARQQIAAGKGSSLADKLGAANGYDAKKLQEFKASASQTSVQRAFQGLNAQNKADVLAKAKPDDLKKLGDLNGIRLQAAYDIQSKRTSDATKQAAQKILKILGGDANALANQKKQQIRASSAATRKATKSSKH